VSETIDGLTFHTAYHDDDERRRALIAFVRSIHGLDLTAWDEAGYWDPRYRPFSLFDGDDVVSNVCVYSMRMVVNGEPTDLAQISAVGTAEPQRQRGLNSELTRRALAWADERHAFTFLFADEEAVAYYRKRGFEPLDETRPRVRPEARPPMPGARKLDLNEPADRRFFAEAVQARAPVSNRLGALEPRLTMFHALYGYLGDLLAVDELGAVVACSRSAGMLTISDVVAPVMPDFKELYPYLASGEAEDVTFDFECDALGVQPFERIPYDGGAHVRGASPLRSPIVFPETARA
jgi:ribosomal protein S18 acetylase RimI-like enzyme